MYTTENWMTVRCPACSPLSLISYVSDIKTTNLQSWFGFRRWNLSRAVKLFLRQLGFPASVLISVKLGYFFPSFTVLKPSSFGSLLAKQVRSLLPSGRSQNGLQQHSFQTPGCYTWKQGDRSWGRKPIHRLGAQLVEQMHSAFKESHTEQHAS